MCEIGSKLYELGQGGKIDIIRARQEKKKSFCAGMDT